MVHIAQETGGKGFGPQYVEVYNTGAGGYSKLDDASKRIPRLDVCIGDGGNCFVSAISLLKKDKIIR